MHLFWSAERLSVFFAAWSGVCVRELCGEICSVFKVAFAVQKVATTCAGNVRGILLCSKDGKKRVRELCGEICSVFKVAFAVQKVATTCAGNVR